MLIYQLLKKGPLMKNKILKFISFAVLILSNAFVFLSGRYSFDGIIEQKANLISQVARKSSSYSVNYVLDSYDHSKNSIGNLTHFCSIQNNNYYNTEPLQYLVTYNATKDKNVYSPELDSVISAVIPGAFSIHLDTKDRFILDSLFIELYYREPNTSFVNEYDNFIYISDNQAKHLRDNVWHLPHDSEFDFSSIINRGLTIEYEGFTYNWKIANVFYNRGRICVIANSIFGYFFLANNYIPNKSTDPFELICSFQQDSFLNYKKIKTTQTIFDLNEYKYTLITNNLLTSYDDILLFPHITQSLPAYYVLVVLTAILFCVFILIYFLKHAIFEDIKSHIFLFSVPVLVWVVFKLISVTTKSVLYLSNGSCIIFFLMILFLILVVSIYHFFEGQKHGF